MGRRLESRAKNWAETISICIVSVRKKDIQGEKGGGGEVVKVRYYVF
jgi:hypothetical protein